MSKLSQYLNEHVVGNVFDRPSILEVYSTDRSILKITPRLVAFPENPDDVRKLVGFAYQLAIKGFELPVTVRGTGLDKTGAALGKGLIISTEKLDHIEEVDLRGRLVRVQPGVTLERLNAALNLVGLHLPVDADPRATIGGLIANCPNDDASDHYGGIFHYVERAEVALASGEIIQLAPYGQRALETKKQLQTPEGDLYREVDRLLDKYGDVIVDRSMQPFDAMGYANITRVRQNHTFNLLPLMFCSQGTLGIITDIILRLEPLPPATEQLAVSFHDLKTAQKFLDFARDLESFSLKVYDLRIIEHAARHGNKPDFFRRKIGNGLLVVVKFGGWHYRTARKIRQCLDSLPDDVFTVIETAETSTGFDALDNALLSFLNDDVLAEREPVLDDVYIPNDKFSDFVRGLKELEEELKNTLPFFGSFATANYHVRPEFDLRIPDQRKKLLIFLRKYAQLVAICQGSITGNGPEGRVKTAVATPLSIGERAVYSEVKNAFDPHHILNPDVKIATDRKAFLQNLRQRPLAGPTLP